jgi:tetratricopeptide (TPR) repeat protein
MVSRSARSWRPTVLGRTDGKPGGSHYPLKFGIAAIFLVTATLVLVLVVLPRRYVLSSGFRESGMNFPVSTTPVATGTLVQRTAPPPPEPLPITDAAVPRGPAEVFWDRVLPLIEAERYDEALALFREYLARYPRDRGVRREYALTLFRAGQGDEAVGQLAELIWERDEPDLRLLRARMLRDLGRVDAASEEYETLWNQGAVDDGLPLEWARALAWAQRYGDAARVLEWALERNPGNPALLVELARVQYASGDLDAARAILSTLDEATLRRLGAVQLRADVEAALAVPVEERPEPPTLLERAAEARAVGELEESARLYRAFLEAEPDHRDAWRAYADLLQYELRDFSGALAALREVERLGAVDPATRLRMAQLESWTGEQGAAETRYQELLSQVQAQGPIALSPLADGTPRRLEEAQLQVLLGDMARWRGDRDGAARRYQAALAVNPGNRQAEEGLVALREDVDVAIYEAESPRLGSRGSTLRDTDDFLMADLGAEWLGTEGDWVWNVFAGNRWLEGYDPSGASAAPSGMFAHAEGGRWWRWGTVRTAVQIGVESVRSGKMDLSGGASALFTDLGTYTFEAAYQHGPAYGRTATLESVFADVTLDEVRVTITNQLTPYWDLWAEARLAHLDAGGVAGASGSLRYEGVLAVGRALRPGFTLGLSAQALGFQDPAPATGPRRLWWDPRLVVTTGPFARIALELNRVWTVTGRVSTGVALMDERPEDGFDRVPHLSGETGLRMRRDRFTAALEVFYLQTRFQGYHSWGARLSLGLLDVLRRGGAE